jgi:hypothetical protein
MLFEDHRNAGLNLNTWINNARGLKRPALILNDLGGNLGGAILKDIQWLIDHLAAGNCAGTFRARGFATPPSRPRH